MHAHALVFIAAISVAAGFPFMLHAYHDMMLDQNLHRPDIRVPYICGYIPRVFGSPYMYRGRYGVYEEPGFQTFLVRVCVPKYSRPNTTIPEPTKTSSEEQPVETSTEPPQLEPKTEPPVLEYEGTSPQVKEESTEGPQTSADNTKQQAEIKQEDVTLVGTYTPTNPTSESPETTEASKDMSEEDSRSVEEQAIKKVLQETLKELKLEREANKKKITEKKIRFQKTEPPTTGAVHNEIIVATVAVDSGLEKNKSGLETEDANTSLTSNDV